MRSRANRFGRSLARFAGGHLVLLIAAFAALVTGFFVPPDKEWLSYPDWKTLTCLFLTLAVINALRHIFFFSLTAQKIIRVTGRLRTLVLVLLTVTFVGSMLIANDMALITFLPLGYFALQQTGNDRYAAGVFILQNIAANLGGMLTPFGNPQNLYLYSYFNIPTGTFTAIMLPPFLVAIALLALCCFAFPRTPLTLPAAPTRRLPLAKTVLYWSLFSLTVLIVFRVVPYWWGLPAVVAVLLIVDRQALAKVDYSLLLTFLCFFIFSGNMARIGVVRAAATALLNKSTLLCSALCCQFISNVPSAILLSHFTENYRELLWGVNIGGTGTLIASLASLITFSHFNRAYPGQSKRYLRLFALLNLLFLGVLLAVTYFVFR